ncbi:hypothetical protein ACTFIU_008963 [Dictyostelium citrinum]
MTKKNNNYLKRDKIFEKRSKNKNKNIDEYGFEIEKPKKQQQQKKPKEISNNQEENDQLLLLKEYSLEETLFWKVWKNKYLKQVILNYLESELKVGIYSYDDIVSVQWLLRNNYIDLLKYKAKRGDLLVDFFDFNNKPRNLYKEVKNDFQLYKDLFKNYPLYFNKYHYKYICGERHMVDPIRFGPHPPRTIKEYTYRESIVNDNVAPFSLLEYDSVDRFYEAIEFGSVDIAKYLFNSKLKSQRNDINGKVWKNHTFINTSTSTQSPKHYNIINKVVNLLIVDLKLIPPKEMNKVCEDIFLIDIKSLKVSELYDCCFTIALLLEQTQFFKDYIHQISKGIIRDKYMNYTGYLQNFLPNPSIDFLTINQINKMKSNHIFLNQTDMSSKVISISKDDQLVHKLIKMLLPFTNYSNNYKENFFYYNFKYFNNGSIDFKVKKRVDVVSPPPLSDEVENKTNTIFIKLKDFKFGDSIERVIFENQELLYSKIEDFNSFELFKVFIDSPIIIKPNKLMTILLGLNRLDLIIQTLDILLNEIPKEKLFPVGLLGHIKSIEIFDYLLLNIKSLKDEFSFNNCLENNNGLNLMEHIKNNHYELYLQFLNSIDPISTTPIHYSFNSLMFIYKNIKDFYNFYERIDIWTRWNYFSLTMDHFIQLVQYTPIDKKYSYHCGTLGNDDLVLKRLHWVKKYRAYDLISGRCDREYGNKLNVDTETTIHIYNYLFGDMNQIKTFQIPNLTNNLKRNISVENFFSKVFKLIGSRGDVKALEIIMEILQSKPIVTDLYYNLLYGSVLTPILVQAVKNCKFKVFDFLKLKYPWIFDDCLINTQDVEEFHRSAFISSLLSSTSMAASENLTFMQLLRSNYFNEVTTKKRLY